MIYSFGDCRIDAAAYELERAGDRVKVEPQVLDLLLLLLENRERIVTRDEIIESVWGGRIVSEAAISSRVKAARQATGDTGKEQAIIRTVHGRGFRFVAPVDADEAAPAAPVEPLSPHPPTKYAKSGDVHIAYQIFGSGPVELVIAPGFISQIDNYWDEPSFNRWLARLGRIARVAMFDKRGTGLSDQVPNLPGMDERMDDVRAVMDAAGFETAVVMGVSEGGSLAALFGATYPERTEGLILFGAFAQFHSWFPNDDALQMLYDYVETAWGTGNSVGLYAPSMVGDEDFRVWWGKFERLGGTPRAVVDLMNMNKEIDISAILPSIAVPTLVIHRTQDTLVDVEGGRFLAANIPGARYVELPGHDHLPFVSDNAGAVIEAIADFVASLPKQGATERFVATVLALRLDGGDDGNPLGLLDGPVRLVIARNGGHLTELEAGSATARFSGPARALKSAVDIVALLHEAGRQARAGVHTGEVDLAEASAGGIAAAIAGEIGDLAAQGEVIASRTVKDLVAGSGIGFEEAGSCRLAGLDEEWRLYRAIA